MRRVWESRTKRTTRPGQKASPLTSSPCSSAVSIRASEPQHWVKGPDTARWSASTDFSITTTRGCFWHSQTRYRLPILRICCGIGTRCDHPQHLCGWADPLVEITCSRISDPNHHPRCDQPCAWAKSGTSAEGFVPNPRGIQAVSSKRKQRAGSVCGHGSGSFRTGTAARQPQALRSTFSSPAGIRMIGLDLGIALTEFGPA